MREKMGKGGSFEWLVGPFYAWTLDMYQED